MQLEEIFLRHPYLRAEFAKLEGEGVVFQKVFQFALSSYRLVNSPRGHYGLGDIRLVVGHDATSEAKTMHVGLALSELGMRVMDFLQEFGAPDFVAVLRCNDMREEEGRRWNVCILQ